MARAQKLHALKTGHRPGHAGEGEDLVDAAEIGLCLDHAGGEEALDLRREEEPIALTGPVKRGDAEAVASEGQLVAFHIVEGDRELAAEALEHRLMTLLPEVGNDLRVAVGDEVMSPPCQFRAPFDVIKQLSVEDHKNTAVFIGDRLLAVGETDDAESA